MRRTQQNGANIIAEPHPAPPARQETALPPVPAIAAVPPVPAMPPGELEGMEEFGMCNWVSFDAPRGKMVCRNQEAEYDEFQAVILESRVVRVMKDEEGGVFCASSDRITADTGRIGRECDICEDKNVHCFPRWWIAWKEVESGLVFAHTLSQTGSLNFHRYVARLQKRELTPSLVLTRIFVEDARRQKSGTLYRRLQFEQVGGSE